MSTVILNGHQVVIEKIETWGPVKDLTKSSSRFKHGGTHGMRVELPGRVIRAVGTLVEMTAAHAAIEAHFA